MTLPANIRINMGAPFPATVKGGGPVTVTKQNGNWTVSLSFAALGGVAAGTDPTTVEVLLWNTALQTFQQATAAQLLAITVNSPTKITVLNSPYAAKTGDSIIYVDTSGGPVEIDLAAANTRSGAPLTIKDITGNAAANNVTIKPIVGETVDGYTNAAPLKITANYGGFRLNPYTNSNLYVIAP